MSWKDIIKAPTPNFKDSRRYSGNRQGSYINDKMMEDIVKGLGLPETKENGEKIEYDEEVDFFLVPSLKSLGDDNYEIEIKFEGKLNIWDEDGKNLLHEFKVNDIEYESMALDITEKPFALDYEFSQYYGGKIYLDVFVKK